MKCFRVDHVTSYCVRDTVLCVFFKKSLRWLFDDSLSVIRELSEEERRKIEMSEDFLNFFGRASAILERAMFEEIDIFTDYSGADSEEQRG